FTHLPLPTLLYSTLHSNSSPAFVIRCLISHSSLSFSLLFSCFHSLPPTLPTLAINSIADFTSTDNHSHPDHTPALFYTPFFLLPIYPGASGLPQSNLSGPVTSLSLSLSRSRVLQSILKQDQR
ncbi:MAG: hypothetical protein BYD32DRAFT_487479, partial [Podila humilis]